MLSTRPAEHGWPQGDVPGEIVFRDAVPNKTRAAIATALSRHMPDMDLAGMQALSSGQWPNGRYSLAHDGRTWFVRVSEYLGEPELEADLIGHLARAGVPVNEPALIGVPLEYEGRPYRVDVRPFLAGGRHSAGSLADLTALGKTLGACHRALRDFPRAAAIREAARTRYERLAGVARTLGQYVRDGAWDRFVELGPWAKKNAAWISLMAAEFNVDFVSASDAQSLHGEIHRANVLFAPDGRAVLLDFEESVHNFAPPAWDLAYAVQRFCLHDDPAPDIFSTRLAAFQAGYGMPVPDLRPMMRQVAWIINALIIDLCVVGRQIKPIAEYDKFVRLERAASALSWP